MRFANIPKSTLEDWDKILRRTLSRTIHNGRRVKNEALQLVTGLLLPSNYYAECRAADTLEALNNDGHMGNTTRARLADEDSKRKSTRQKQGFGKSAIWGSRSSEIIFTGNTWS